jgi:penicillin-binding protein 1C
MLISFLRKNRHIALFIFLLVAGMAILRVMPKPSLARGVSSSVAVYDTSGRLLRLTLSPDDKYRLWIPLKDMSPQLVEAVLLHEDQHFRSHPGVNPVALVRATYRTFIAGERRQGGSTLTMQLARMKYRIASRSIPGKIEQIVRAVQLEIFYSKADILEAYLNLVPYGANIEGAGAASLIYFGKRAEKLSLSESLALAVIPQSPVRRGSGKGIEIERDALLRARTALFTEWSAQHPEDGDKVPLMQSALKLKRIDELPFAAPHAVDALLAQRRDDAGAGAELRSTLDSKMQRLIERRMREYIASRSRLGMRNAAAMLVDYRSMEVKAVVGSADFFNDAIDGQVNGTLAKRSPGSTLKPFVYALGIDQGVLHPLSVLKDAPTSFGPFSPENFDGQFAGPITATDALVKSRNIPAVLVSSRLSRPTLYDFMRQSGIARMKSEAHYGLALVLGGGEVTMEELVTLYAMLGNRGEQKPLRYTVSTSKTAAKPGVRLLSEEASFMVLQMLKQNPRPGETPLAGNDVPVAWKTGTSYGFHDAWSVGVFGPYVLAVWVGDFKGESNPAYIGVQAAAPLFFNIIDAIAAEQKNLAEPAHQLPRHLARVEVCTASGDLPNAACPQKSETWFIPGVSPIRVSTIHRTLAIDARTGLRACPSQSGANVRFDTYEFWPSDMLKLFREAGMPRRVPPSFGAQCRGEVQADEIDGGPKITSPLRGLTYTLRFGKSGASAAGDEVVTLNAVSDSDVREVFWFVNETYLGRSAGGATLAWKPRQPGQFILRAVDDQGRSDARDVRIAMVQ